MHNTTKILITSLQIKEKSYIINKIESIIVVINDLCTSLKYLVHIEIILMTKISN